MLHKTCVLVLGLFSKIFFPYEIEGKDNLKKMKKGFLVCSNHVSNFDPIFISLVLKQKIYFLAKSELFKNKIFSFLFKKLGAIPINRGAHDVGALHHAEEILKSGKILGIFIEGTRSKSGKFLRPKSGAAIIAHETKSSVLPICITPVNGRSVKIFNKTKISIGQPIERIDLGEKSYGEIRLATDSIMSKITELRGY